VPMKLSYLAVPSLLLGLSACQSVDVQRVQEMNPFKRNQEAAPAPVRTGDTSGSPPPAATPTAKPAIAPPARVNYQVPRGGDNTISFSMAGCLDGCPIVNVMIDPDNYWQRVAPEGSKTGQGRAKLYDDIANAFQAQGFYLFQGELNIMPGNEATCSDYQPGGQVFYVSLSRNSGHRIINFDSGCAGSASADGAADAVNTLVGITDYMDVVSGAAK
jgi:hypothetical protein